MSFFKAMCTTKKNPFMSTELCWRQKSQRQITLKWANKTQTICTARYRCSWVWTCIWLWSINKQIELKNQMKDGRLRVWPGLSYLCEVSSEWRHFSCCSLADIPSKSCLRVCFLVGGFSHCKILQSHSEPLQQSPFCLPLPCKITWGGAFSDLTW